jgi:hydrogenase maturation protein HypF
MSSSPASREVQLIAREPLEGRRIVIRGTVQGVGMRPFVYRVARAGSVTGRVWNDVSGVTIEAFGTRPQLDRLVARLQADRPAAARFEELRQEPIPAERIDDFAIVESASQGARRVTIPPDLATCDACLAEVNDPADRRYRYPFTNCTQCGPRFTIARAVPYDRAATTMAPFQMCPACQREYQTPADRRFHAEPNACPDCGPRLFWLDEEGAPTEGAGDRVAEAAAELCAGRILAVKGLGGFHLVCDAASSEAVRTLRARKRRDERPFAVMVATTEEAARLAVLSDAERELLRAPERPIVLLRRRSDAQLAPEVAPDAHLVGLFLPYTPLHHLLLAAAGRPLVMTSANLSEEPIVFRNQEARERLGTIADRILAHDREIEARADDSVARVIAGAPTVLRRARGYVPRPISVARSFDRPTLACGALLKNTFCLGLGDQATLGPHIGDLENLETFAAFEEAVARTERFLGTEPRLVAHDLHPEMLSTRYALERARTLGVPAIAVQHHHAHVVSAMAEHRLDGPVLGVAFDGTGYGTDGAGWGGELLLAWLDRFERVATLRPLPLAGGDQAVREPWRLALAALDDAFDGAPPLDRLALFRSIPATRIGVVRRMIASRLNAPLVHGAGRWFDAAAALLLSRGQARHEAQLAMALEGVAAFGDHGVDSFTIDESRSPWQLDLRPLFRRLTEDLIEGHAPAVLAARFHDTLAVATAELIRRAARRYADVLGGGEGSAPVVLTGGCMQNVRLAERISAELAGWRGLYLHRQVPPGDAGIALGQALVANAVARGG